MRSYTSKKRQAFTFTLDEVQFTATGTVPLLAVSELAELADTEVMSPEGAAAIARFFRAALGKAEYTRFRNHCDEHGTDVDTLLEIFADLCSEGAQVPTVRPSDSSAGPPSTGPTLKVISSDGKVREEAPLSPERAAALREAVARATG